MRPLVTILMPCYNHENFVLSCLDSVIAQTYDNMEIIICDDCSVDESYNLIKSKEDELKKRFSTVLLRNEHNLGVTKNLNKMLKIAHGKYIKILATDDMLMPTAIETFVDYALENDFDVLYSNMYKVGPFDKYPEVLSKINCLTLYYDRYTPLSGKNLTSKLISKCFIGAPGTFIPMKTYLKYGFYDESFPIEDWEFWLRVSITGNIDYLDSTTTFYRLGINSLSHSSFEGNIEREIARNRNYRFFKVKKEIFEKYENYSDDDSKKKFFNNELQNAILFKDSILIKELICEMKTKKIKISIKNILKYFLQKIGLFYFVKKLVKSDNNS